MSDQNTPMSKKDRKKGMMKRRLHFNTSNMTKEITFGEPTRNLKKTFHKFFTSNKTQKSDLFAENNVMN